MATAIPLIAPILSPEKTSRPALHSSPARSSSRASRRVSRTPAKTRQSLIQSQEDEECEEPSPSPRKAILRNPGAVSFTPKGVKKAPRAWERRPATPYVPRREGEKIWKRVVLGDLGGEVNRDVRKSEDYVRVVKKLKMNTDEGVRVMTCVEDEGACATRKVPVNFGLAEGDHEHDVYENGNSEEVVPTWEPDRETDDVANDGLSEYSNADSTDDETPSLLNASEANDDVGGDDVVAQPDVSTQLTLEAEAECSTNEDHVDEQDSIPMKSSPAADVAQVPEVAETIIAHEDVPTEQNSLGAEDVAEEECEEVKREEVDQVANKSVTSPTLDTTGLANAEDFSPITQHITELPVDQQEVEDETHKPLESLAAPESTSISQVAGTDESSSAIGVPQAGASIEEDAEQVAPPAEESRAIDNAEASQDNTRPRPSLDDAAFLHAFLSRTKAQREARNLEKQEVDSQEAAPAAVEDGAERAEPTEPEVVESEIPVASAETGPELKAQDTVTEDDQASPVRRSKRTATVQSSAASIPRIQLKRAVGSEFIFTANKSQTPANVAMMTRTNTKRNRGQAVGVSTRLDQLRSRLDAEENGAGVDADEGNTGKKRKRDKADKVELAAKKKVLRWNDDRLTAYREADAYAEEEMEIERERTPEMESNKEEDEQDEEMSALAKRISSPSKVRRVRRNVAATPVVEAPAIVAPLKAKAKGRSKRSASEQAVVEADVPAVEIEKDSKAAAGIPGPRRSRMPVRVGRPGKASNGETAKSTKAQTQGSGNGNSEAKADDGLLKRRLRVRS